MSQLPAFSSSFPLLRIVVVEDHDDARDSFVALLQSLGHETRGVRDGNLALAVVAEFRPDVAFIDIKLTGMDGYELASRLRDMYGGTMRLYAISGFCRPQDRARALTCGFDEHFAKPVEVETLVQVLRKNISESALTNRAEAFDRGAEIAMEPASPHRS